MHYKNGGLHGRDAVTFAKLIIDRLKEAEVKRPAIIMRGVSGMIVGAVVAAKLKAPMAVIRKDNEDSHSYEAVEGISRVDDSDPLVIVDDFVSSGDTILSMLYLLAENGFPHDGQKIYGVLYDQDSKPAFDGLTANANLDPLGDESLGALKNTAEHNLGLLKDVEWLT